MDKYFERPPIYPFIFS